MDAQRDLALRTLAHDISVTVAGNQFDVALGAALIWAVTQLDVLQMPEADEYAARRLRQIADVIEGRNRERH